MKGRLYTAHEIFEAMRLSTEEEAEKHPDFMAQLMVTQLGAAITSGTADKLGFDEEQLRKYCLDKICEDDDEEDE